LMHDSKQELAQPFGRIQDWSKGEGKPIPGKTMPQIHVVERDYRQVYDKMNALGPNVETKPLGANGISWSAKPEYDKLKKMLGTIDGGVGDVVQILAMRYMHLKLYSHCHQRRMEKWQF